MKLLKLTILAIFLFTTSIFAYNDGWLYQGKFEVGMQPSTFLNPNFSDIYFILCNGIDQNKNGIQEEGDEAPSIWYMEANGAMITAFQGFINPYSIPQKLIDLPFRHQEMPFRGTISEKYDKSKIYVDTKDGLAEISLDFDYVNNAIKITPTLKIINQLHPVHILWASEYNTNQQVLFLSVRDSENNKGYVLKYNLETGVYTDTIPAQSNIMMSALVDYGKEIYILNNSNDIDKNSVWIYHIGKVIGDGSPLLLKKIDVPQRAYAMQTEVMGFKAVISSPTTDTITTINSNYTKSNIDTKNNNVTGLKSFYAGSYSSWATATDGNIYQVSSNFNAFDTLDAYGIPESVDGNYAFLIITTPFQKDKTPDNTITLYAKDIVSVEENQQVNNMIYPNPVSDIIYIRDSNDQSYKLFSLMGELILEGNGSKIDVNKLPNGAYFIIIDNKIQPFVKN